ncbi:MAG: hypothetical protein ACK5OC_22255 [Pirellula sp.]
MQRHHRDNCQAIGTLPESSTLATIAR